MTRGSSSRRIARWSHDLAFRRIDLDSGRAVLVEAYAHAPRPATHLAVFFILLAFRAAPIEQDFDFLFAIGADHDRRVVTRLQFLSSK